MPNRSVARLIAAPPIQIATATSARLRRAGWFELGWLFSISNVVLVCTSGDAGASSANGINEGAIVHAGSMRVIAGWPAASTIDAARIQCRSAAG